MKSVVVCLLLILMNAQFGHQLDEDDPPIFSINKLETKPVVPSKKFIELEDSRLVGYTFANNVEYIMSVDPPEHCTRFIVCTVKDYIKKTCGGDDSLHAYVVYLHGKNKGKIYEKLKNTQGLYDYKDVESANAPNYLDNYVKIKQSGQELELTFKKIVLATTDDQMDIMEPIVHKLTTNGLHANFRVETSSSYCNVRIGEVNAEAEPSRNKPKWNGYSIEIEPFKYGKKIPTVKERLCFGPLFKKDGAAPTSCQPTVDITAYVKDVTAQCPFAHDWIGFAKWSEATSTAYFVDKGPFFWRGPFYQYSLQALADANCGSEATPIMIDIEIDAVINLKVANPTCIGFALAFGGEKSVKLEAKSTFEFYPAAMMFLAPDSDKIRELRINREGLRKIRISFFKNPPTEDPKNFAVVEYGFLNKNIAGVREYVFLPDDAIANYKTVTLLQEGYCNVRVLKAPQPQIDKPCWDLQGCDVLMKPKPQ